MISVHHSSERHAEVTGTSDSHDAEPTVEADSRTAVNYKHRGASPEHQCGEFLREVRRDWEHEVLMNVDVVYHAMVALVVRLDGVGTVVIVPAVEATGADVAVFARVVTELVLLRSSSTTRQDHICAPMLTVVPGRIDGQHGSRF